MQVVRRGIRHRLVKFRDLRQEPSVLVENVVNYQVVDLLLLQVRRCVVLEEE